MRVSSVIVLFFGLAFALSAYASEEKQNNVEVVAEAVSPAAVEAVERRTRRPHPTHPHRPTRGSRRPRRPRAHNRNHRRLHGSSTPASIVQKREAGFFNVQVVDAGRSRRPHPHHWINRRGRPHHQSTTPASIVEKREAGFNVLVDVEAAGKDGRPVTRRTNGGGKKSLPRKPANKTSGRKQNNKDKQGRPFTPNP
ncbi:unnamed protein product [Bursaphelenchus xylophilus]|nr:unnamed protein product [Bursaphelenchus xylophilus]CAG9118064.1 unnamed protein product [Bursaphelenchus xylophilus]